MEQRGLEPLTPALQRPVYYPLTCCAPICSERERARWCQEWCQLKCAGSEIQPEGNEILRPSDGNLFHLLDLTAFASRIVAYQLSQDPESVPRWVGLDPSAWR